MLGHFEQGLQRKWKERLSHNLASFQEALTQARLAEAAERQLFTDLGTGTNNVGSIVNPLQKPEASLSLMYPAAAVVPHLRI